MRILFFILLANTFCFGQSIEPGMYFTRKKDISFESEIFDFKEDSTFNYIVFGCTGKGFGKGKYFVDDSDSLNLQFLSCEDFPSFNEVHHNYTDTDIIKINLVIKDFMTKEPLPGVACFIKGTSNGWISDVNGRIEGEFSQTSTFDILAFQTPGYEHSSIFLNSSVMGEIYLTNTWIYDENDQKTYKILDSRNRKFIVRLSPEYTITYNKIPENKKEKFLAYMLGETYFNFYKQGFLNDEVK